MAVPSTVTNFTTTELGNDIYDFAAILALDGDINDTQTSLDVTGTVWGSAPFTIAIGTETMWVESIASQTFTVTRGIEGSTATSHSDGDNVKMVIGATFINQHRRGLVELGPTKSPTFAGLDLTGSVFIGDTANSDMTQGLTINQGANDDEILALKSSDIAHGITDEAETDTFGTLKKASVSDGGLNLQGISDGGTGANYALLLNGLLDGTANTTKSTSGQGVVAIYAKIRSGTSITNVGANGNLLTIHNYATTRFIFDAEGSAHADVEWTTYDKYDDVIMLRDLEATLVPDVFGKTVKYGKDFFESTGILHDVRETDNGKTRGMLNQTKMLMLHTGAITQTNKRLDRALEEVAALKKTLLEAGIESQGVLHG